MFLILFMVCITLGVILTITSIVEEVPEMIFVALVLFIISGFFGIGAFSSDEPTKEVTEQTEPKKEYVCKDSLLILNNKIDSLTELVKQHKKNNITSEYDELNYNY